MQHLEAYQCNRKLNLNNDVLDLISMTLHTILLAHTHTQKKKKKNLGFLILNSNGNNNYTIFSS